MKKLRRYAVLTKRLEKPHNQHLRSFRVVMWAYSKKDIIARFEQNLWWGLRVPFLTYIACFPRGVTETTDKYFNLQWSNQW